MKKLLLTAALVSICFNVDAQTEFVSNSPWRFDTKALPVLPHETVQNAFNAVKKSGIEFRYPQGGCQQRAEMMHTVLSHFKVPHARIFIFAPIDLVEGSDIKLEIRDPSGLSTDNTIKWPYHVAPLVSEIGADNKPQLMVIDPALNPNSPLALKDWFAKMTNANISQYAVVVPDAYFFYTKNNSTVISGDFYKYEDLTDPAIISLFDNAVLERELALNDVALFLKEELDGGYKDPQNEIKTLLSSVNSMVGFFASQNNSNQVKGVTIREVLERHAVLLNQAMKYYTDRVTFWMKNYRDLKTGMPVQLQTEPLQADKKGNPQKPQGNRVSKKKIKTKI